MEQVLLPACPLLCGFCAIGAGLRVGTELLFGLYGINEQLEKSVFIVKIISALPQKTCSLGLCAYPAWFCAFRKKKTSSDQCG